MNFSSNNRAGAGFALHPTDFNMAQGALESAAIALTGVREPGVSKFPVS